ncbi:uncharacterized protein A1O9_08951 [Exophiala aquamarina CBS 119918]|uniref:DUF7514 domain-containing protein n=1 Tax=Exophiala aquamarina CBS 119918 TaxID=1182545 RepID=A0A072P6H7_9EURO|nr:uncharacterized protein A1O9_08951 [Exophiala aquamarina CBS 119918]KEF55297.1 hypothetical protein A1O9_08951 [Exophiala aquamarina CBS 119918]
MASLEDRLPSQPGMGTLADQGDSRRLHPVHSNSSSDPRQQRPRGSSNTASDSGNIESTRCQQARQPINDAVKSAFNSTDAASNATFPPDLLQQITSQITANVLSQLRASNISLPSQQSHLSASQMDALSSTAGSPPLDRSTVYTPPSPYRNSEDLGHSQQSPQFPPFSSAQSSFRAASPPVERRPISPSSQASHMSEAEAHPDRSNRPKGPRRISTGADTTILERIWGPLFNEQGQATARLGQFLRGIAVHLIDNYEPKQSLVVTPSKLQRYYEETKLTSEHYPWKIIFDDRTSSISRMFREIEAQHHLVQDKPSERPDTPGLTPQGFETWATLLLRAHPDQEFERLAKTALDMPISNPDEKKERFPKELSRRLFPNDPDTEVAYKLQKAMSTHCNVTFSSSARQGSVADTPGPSQNNNQSQSQPQSQSQAQPPLQPQLQSQPQNTATTQPTQPTQPNQLSEEPIQKANLRPSMDTQEPVVNGIKSSPALSHASLERQRQPYSGVPTSDAVSSGSAVENEEEGMPTPQPIERERKPYVSTPGLGKNYDNLDKPITAPAPAPVPDTRSSAPQSEPKLSRSGSFHTGSRPTVIQSKPGPIPIHTRVPPPPMDIPETRHHRSNSVYHKDQPRRTRSPSTSKENGTTGYIRRGESDVPYVPASHYHASPSDTYEDMRRHREYEAQRERLANDRYDAARMAAYDPRERERERERDNRPRMQSVSGYDQQPRPPYNGTSNLSEEEYYRERRHLGEGGGSYTTTTPISTGFQFHPPPVHTNSTTSRDGVYGSYPSSARYPPSSYKDMQ